jgi:hypothetical protein
MLAAALAYAADGLSVFPRHAPHWLLDLLTPKAVERAGSRVVPTISMETTKYGKRAIELECESVRTTPKANATNS